MISFGGCLDGIGTALAKAQAVIANAAKDSTNPHFKSKYADLATILNVVRPVFSEYGIAVIQSPSYDGESGMASVTTMLLHSSGQYLTGTCSAPVTKSDPQGVGSAITYLRRYSLAAFAGIAQEDDDGNAASGGKGKKADKKPLFITPTDVIKAAIAAAENTDTLKKQFPLIKAHSVAEQDSLGRLYTARKKELNDK